MVKKRYNVRKTAVTINTPMTKVAKQLVVVITLLNPIRGVEMLGISEI